tara:strand:- start:379 stop:768 length:390 start_codon:yes stop_codon:yes gene_type:complete
MTTGTTYDEYVSENRTARHYRDHESNSNTNNRDIFDSDQMEIQKLFAQRHSTQLDKAVDAEVVDGEWIADKSKVIELNRDIRVRRKNFDTYKNAIEVEKTLYNRERHTTILLGCMNAAAIGGCLYVWLM